MTRVTWLTLALAVCAPSLPAPADSQELDGVPAGALAGRDCLVVVLDALHAGQLGCHGGPPGVSPVIDELAGQGVRFSRAWSQTSWTLPSTASLFTGLYQETHGVHFDVGVRRVRLAEEAVTLAELFARAGYDTAAYSENPFASSIFGLDQGFERFHDVSSSRQYKRPLIYRVAGRLARPAERPRFTYVHLRRPHGPYDAPPEQAAPFVDDDYDGPVTGSPEDIEAHNRNEAPMDARDLAHHRGLYLANIAEADAELGRILEAVDTERTLVVLLSDHGEALAQHGTLGHNWRSYEEYVHIPFVLSHPGLPQGVVRDAPVMSIDVLPTLAELFGLPTDGLPLQGRSLVPLLEDGTVRDRRAVYTSSRRDTQGRRQLAIREGQLKYMREEPSGREWLFDLASDPGEQENLVLERPRDVVRLARLLAGWQAGQTARFVVEGEDIDPETMRDFEALGYVGRERR